MEFINKDSRDQNQWTFFKSSIAVSKVTLDERIISQYSNINTPPEPQPEPEVIKLFEE
jgi:hypothetical protein